MKHSLVPAVLLSTLGGIFALGCGGATEITEDSTGGSGHDRDSGGTGSGTGGKTMDGGGGRPGAGGNDATAGSGGEQACCLAAALCDPGDTQIDSEQDCPEGATCYSNHICCSTVWCIDEPEVTCDAIPVCPAGTRETTDCAEDDASCTSHSLCGTTIHCVPENPPSCGGGPRCPDGTREVDECPEEGDCSLVTACGEERSCLADPTCNPDEEYNRMYVGSPDSCPLILFSCEPGTEMFGNSCGCGCEQPTECPRSVDCMPTFDGEHSPLCSSNDCPLTPRVY